MLELVDAFITSQLEQVKFNYAVAEGGLHYRPVKVYPYIPERDKGQTIYPSYAYTRAHVEYRPKSVRAGGHEVFRPLDSDGVFIEGDAPFEDLTTFDRKPYPTPVNLFYAIDSLATEKTHHDWLTEMLFQVFPPGFQAEITGLSNYGTFFIEKVSGLDELEKPVFRSSYVLGVFDLWLDRAEHYSLAPVVDITTALVELDSTVEQEY
jgi:hypothetical protein